MVRSACMNNAGQYAFLAYRDDGSQAIYVGSGTNYEQLISTGMMLDGNEITNLSLSSQGISENGKIGFLADNNTGSAIYVAAVPEPGIAGLFAITLLSALGLRQRR